MSGSKDSILWHDYETWGINPSVDFPVQFAAIRTDLDLNIIESESPANLLCKIPHDYLPHPQACLVTGITPNYSHLRGLSEPEFAQRVYRHMSQANTCVAGYNSMKFDEEVTRFLLFRNLFPVYEREYKNGNSKWDIIDLVRACYALRPEGVNWPHYDDGKPCFKLEALTQENGLNHDNAHDALSDVYATIAIAKLIKEKQPKLYSYYWQLRNKQNVFASLQQFLSNVFVHISPFYNSFQGCCSLIMPVCPHPTNKNAVLCIDLTKPIERFLKGSSQSNIEETREIIFAKTPDNTKSNQAHASEKPGLISISANKCPFIAPIKTLSQQQADTLGIDITLCTERFKQLRDVENLRELCEAIVTFKEPAPPSTNIDTRLYDLPFISPHDANLMTQIRHSLPEQLASYQGSLTTTELNELLFRYRARNYPHLLDETEMKRWQEHLIARFTDTNQKDCLSLSEFVQQIEQQRFALVNQPEKLKILDALSHYAKQISMS